MIVRIDHEEAEHIWTAGNLPWFLNGVPATNEIDFNNTSAKVLYEVRPEKLDYNNQSRFFIVSVDELVRFKNYNGTITYSIGLKDYKSESQ